MLIDKSKKNSIRKSFGSTLAMLGEKNKDIVVMDADLACSTQTIMFGNKYPERFFDNGIAEQDMIATAAGLASEGKIPFVSTFAMFATGRTYDQIRNSICYPEFNVKIVGTHGGVTVGEDGATHQALEDVSLMRSIPNMTVVVPADCKECEEVIKFAADYKGPMYIRLSRCNVPDIFSEDYKFDLNAKVLVEGSDVTLISNGESLAEAIEASNELQKHGINAEVIHVPVVKPIDSKTIIDSAKKTNKVVVVENHSIIGGLGSAVCEVLSENYPTKILRIGVNDEFGQSGKSDELVKFYGLDSESIVEKVENFLNK